MDTYLSTIDNYIQEEDEKLRQQQLFYIQQEQIQHQQPQQQVLNSSSWSTSFATNPYIQSVIPIPQQHMYTSNMSDYQQQTSMSPSLPPVHPQSTCDPNTIPPKIRKKPGRRPNPASPAHRKEQNRAAQRAFRERKERRLLELESSLQTLEQQHHTTEKELTMAKHQLKDSKTETWYLRGVILTLQFMLMHHNIGVPAHSPYLSEETLAEMAKTHPHSIKAYVKAYTQNDNHQQPDHPVLSPDDNSSSSCTATSSPSPFPDEELDTTKAIKEEHTPYHQNQASISSPNSLCNQDDIQDNDNKGNVTSCSIPAIQQIQLQLRAQSTVATISNPYQPSQRLESTPLQRLIDHDPRIDLIPSPQMRDRMIIFRNQMDYDHCFNMLLDGAIYNGGDPTLSRSWQLPPLFYSEYWFLSTKYDLLPPNGCYRTKQLHIHNSPETTTATATTWADGDPYSLALASSVPIYGIQQPKHTSSSESLSALSHLRL